MLLDILRYNKTMSYHPGWIRGRGRYSDYHGRGSDRQQRTVNHPVAEKASVSSKNISKHDNNCCSDISISLDLNESELNFFTDLKNMWNMCKYNYFNI